MHAKQIIIAIGLQRTDNNMLHTTWPQVNMINQKNYYTYVCSLFHHSLIPTKCSDLVDRMSEVQDGQQKHLEQAEEGDQGCLCSQHAICQEVRKQSASWTGSVLEAATSQHNGLALLHV